MPFCPKCGARTAKEDEFCRECGTRIAPTRPPTKPAALKAKPPAKPAPSKVKPALAKPRVEGRGWSMGKKVAVLSIVCTIGVVAIVLILLLSGGGIPTGIKDPATMSLTLTDLPSGWSEASWSSAGYLDAASATIGTMTENMLTSNGYELGYNSSTFIKSNSWVASRTFRFSSIAGATNVMESNDTSLENAYNVTAVSVPVIGDESYGYDLTKTVIENQLYFRKSNIVVVISFYGISWTDAVNYAQIIEKKI